MSNFKRLIILQKKMNRIAGLTSKMKQKGFLLNHEEIRIEKLERMKGDFAEEIINIINEEFGGLKYDY
jgi:hypothetical protein